MNKKDAKHNFKTYLILLTVFLLSFGVVYLLQAKANEVLQGFLAAPVVSTLFATLYQLIRDQVAHEKQIEIQDRQFQFTLGAASHMANIAFDKHVAFCEEYMKEIQSAWHLMMRGKEIEKLREYAGKFYKLRDQYEVWLTDEINQILEKFENDLLKLGTKALLIKKRQSEGQLDEQYENLIQAYDFLLNKFLGIADNKDDEKIVIKAIKKKVCAILDVEKLSNIRSYLVEQASRTTRSV